MGRRQSQKALLPSGTSVPNPVDILSSVASLYADELKPVSRILRKRLLERTGAETVCIEQLRSACEACALLNVELCGVSDWAALLLDREATFVNISSPQDVYPPELWLALQTYWNGPGKGMCLHGGRYAFGQTLQQVSLPCLAGRSFGQVCHIVQLALSQKKLLGYRDGCIGPYTRSELMCKEHCALRQQPCVGSLKSSAASQLPVATWDEARTCLQEMLRRAGGKVALANVKRMFHSQFSLELSETAFGHSRVSDLLRDPRLQHVCRLDLQSNGYMVVQVNSPSTESSPCSDSSTAISALCGGQSPAAQPLSPMFSLSAMALTEGPLRVHSEHCSGAPLSVEDAKILSDDMPVLLVPTLTPGSDESKLVSFTGWSLSSTLAEQDARKEAPHVGPILPRHAATAGPTTADEASKDTRSRAVEPLMFLWNHALAGWSDYSWGDQLMCSGEVDAAQEIRLADGPTAFVHPGYYQPDLLQEPEVQANNGQGFMFTAFAGHPENCETTDKVKINTEADQAVANPEISTKAEPGQDAATPVVNTNADSGSMFEFFSFVTSVAAATSDQAVLTAVAQPMLPPPGLSLPQEIPKESEDPECTPEEAASLQQTASAARSALYGAISSLVDIYATSLSNRPTFECETLGFGTKRKSPRQVKQDDIVKAAMQHMKQGDIVKSEGRIEEATAGYNTSSA